jgi:hypothetical protein
LPESLFFLFLEPLFGTFDYLSTNQARVTPYLKVNQACLTHSDVLLPEPFFSHMQMKNGKWEFLSFRKHGKNEIKCHMKNETDR